MELYEWVAAYFRWEDTLHQLSCRAKSLKKAVCAHSVLTCMQSVGGAENLSKNTVLRKKNYTFITDDRFYFDVAIHEMISMYHLL